MKNLLLLTLIISNVTFAGESLTDINIQGQKFLFNHGWFVITSPTEAWDTAVKNHESSKKAFNRAVSKIKLDKKTFSSRVSDAGKTIESINEKEIKTTEGLMENASELQAKSFAKSSQNFQDAWKKLSLGYLNYQENTSEDLEALTKVNTEFFGRVSTQFKSIDKAMEPVLGHLLQKSEVSWKQHFRDGKFAFNQQYEKSGTRGNSLSGLWDILVGYTSWTFNALVKPTSKTVYSTVKGVPYYTTEGVLKTFIASFNVVHSLGANVYFSSKLGYKLISPSLEAGYLSGLAMMNAFNGAVTSNALRTAGIINKVAIKASAPVAGGAQLAFEEVASKASDAATVVFYGSQAVGEVVMEKAESGVVLGYSALSQIPPQVLLTGMNSAIFLVYDGPKLLLAKVTGKIGDVNVDELPEGVVLDLKKAKEEKIQVETLSEDPETIKKVLQNVD